MDGKSSAGTLEADSQDIAVQILFEQGLFVTDIREVGGTRAHEIDGATYASGVGQGFFSTIVGNIVPFVTLGELTAVTRGLATAFNAGLPLDAAVASLRTGQVSPLMRQALRDISDQVERGHSLSEAMDSHPRVFNKMYRGMVSVGEGSGTLDEILGNLAEMFEEELELRRRIQSMMVYPGCIVVVILAATLILGYLGFIPMQIFYMVLLVLAVIFVFWLLNKNRHISQMFRTILSVLPGIGGLIRRISVARVCFALGTMIRSGVPYLQTLDWARDSANLPFVESGLRRAYRDVSGGMPLSDSLTRAGIFPPMARNLLKVGEEAGSVDEMLMKIYQYMRQEINYQTRNLVSVLGPTLILILAVVVGIIVIQFWAGYFTTIMEAVGE